MRTPIAVLLLAAILAVPFLPATPADAREGVFRGPGDRVPPGLREPSDPMPPPPPPPGPVVPGSPGETPTVGPTHPRVRDVVSFEDWRFWYHHNKDYREWRPGKITPEGPTAATHAKILETLLAVARAPEDHDPEVAGGALIALGKAASKPEHVEVLVAALADEKAHQVVAESAALGLGLVGRAKGREVFDTPVFDHMRSKLFDVLEDDRRQGRLRQVAACAIGLLGDQPTGVPGWSAASTTTRLFAMLDTPQAHPTFEVGILRGIALQQTGSVTADQIQLLEDMARRGRLGNRSVNDHTRSHAIVTLGAVGDADSVGVLDETLRNRRGISANMRRSAAVALGRLATRLESADRKRAIQSLLRALHEQRDTSTQNFATMELFPAVSTNGLVNDLMAETGVAEAFQFHAAHGYPLHRPYAAMAAGLLVSTIRKETQARWPKRWADRTAGFLRNRLQSAEPAEQRALALALGLARDVDSAGALRALAADAQQAPSVRGYALLGLAHTGDRSAETLAVARAALGEDVTDPTHRRLAACALGLLQDGASVAVLKAEVVRARSKEHKGEAVAALAKVGTVEAAEALLSLATDPSLADPIRALGYAGLGRIVDGEPVPALGRLTICVNYRASSDLMRLLFALL
jgi:hypothetical protein